MRNIGFKWILLGIYYVVVLLFIHFRGDEHLTLINVIYLTGPMTAIVAGILTLRRLGWEGKRAQVLKIMILALVCWFVAEIISLYLTWKGETPYPSLADVLFLSGYALFCAAVVMEVRLFGLHWKKLSIPLLVVMGTIFLAVVSVVVYVAMRGYKIHESLLVNLTTISWSIGDLIMGGLGLVLLAMVWQYRTGAVKREWLWFMFATTINLIADTIYNLYPGTIISGSWLNALLNSMWVAGYLLFAGYFLELHQELGILQTKANKKPA